MRNSEAVDFYGSESYLVIGMSRKRRNFAWTIYEMLRRSDKKVFAVHPDGGEHKGVEFFRNIDGLPEKPEACVVSVNLKKNNSILADLADSGIEKIWFQEGSYDGQVLNEAEKRNLKPITGCSLMYMPAASFPHNLHRFFHELFSKGKN